MDLFSAVELPEISKKEPGLGMGQENLKPQPVNEQIMAEEKRAEQIPLQVNKRAPEFPLKENQKKTIEKIVVFYTDKTFTEYLPGD
jgi:hypothetical protein